MSAEYAQFWESADIEAQRAHNAGAYLEFLRIASMSAGLYVLAAGSTDAQLPHRQDELYYVMRGVGRIQVGTHDRAVKSGTLIFVAAEAQHRFHSIEEELSVLVLFAPAETA